jgi:hypothetical protein
MGDEEGEGSEVEYDKVEDGMHNLSPSSRRSMGNLSSVCAFRIHQAGQGQGGEGAAAACRCMMR